MGWNLSNAPGHAPDFIDLNTNGLEVKIVYLTPNTPVLLQPMDKRAVATFKVYYLQTTMKRIAGANQVSDNVTLRDWKSYYIMKEILAFQQHGMKCQNYVWMACGVSFNLTAFWIHKSRIVPFHQ
jgi:hypothetical protein